MLRVVRWYITALHDSNGIPASQLPLSSAKELQLLTTPHTDTNTDTRRQLGVLAPTQRAAARLPADTCKTLLSGLVPGLDIRYGQVVTEVVQDDEDDSGEVTVVTDKGELVCS